MNKKISLSILVLVAVVIGSSVFSSKGVKPVKAIPRIGVLQYVSHPALDDIYRGVQDGLAEKGYVDGESVVIDFQNGQGDQSKLTTMSQQLISQQADVLVGIATPAAQSLASQTTATPIILGAVSDPQAANLVADNDHPGGNITGVSDQSPVASQLELALQLVPTAKTVGVLYSSAEDNSASQAKKVKVAGEKLGLKIKTYPVASSNDIAKMTQVMTSEVDLIYLPTDNTIANAFQVVVENANQEGVPIIPSVDTMVAEGGLATVGINQYELGLQTGRMAGDVLSGKAEPATTPVFTFDSGDIILNQEQLNKQKITVPSELLKQAKIVNQEGV